MNELQQIQQNTNDMLDDIAIYAGIMWILAGSGIIGFLIWLGHKLL